MKWKWWTLLAVVLLLTGLASAQALRRSSQKRMLREQTLVAAFFAGDPTGFEYLRKEGKRGVSLVEEFIRLHSRPDPSLIQQDLPSLASPDPLVNTMARARLTLFPERGNALLKQAADALPEGTARNEGRHLLANRTNLQKQVCGFLTGLYSGNFAQLFVAKRDALARDCHDLPAQMFFAYAPFDQVWQMLGDSPDEVRIRFLLLRLYTGRDEAAVAYLERYPAAEILRLAGQTWWPVELAGAGTNGAGGPIICAATLRTNVATHILRLTPRPSPTAGSSPEWAAIDRYLRWTYVFKFKEPLLGKSGVIYSEGSIRDVNQKGKPGLTRSQEKEECRLWLPESGEVSIVGPGRCEAVANLPPETPVPIVNMTRQEASHWLSGTVYAWSRAVFPPAMHSWLRFQPDQFPAPQIFADQEQANKARTRRTARKTQKTRT